VSSGASTSCHHHTRRRVSVRCARCQPSASARRTTGSCSTPSGWHEVAYAAQEAATWLLRRGLRLVDIEHDLGESGAKGLDLRWGFLSRPNEHQTFELSGCSDLELDVRASKCLLPDPLLPWQGMRENDPHARGVALL
jgi:hypothetical protein